jgi:hypothetical protein
MLIRLFRSNAYLLGVVVLGLAACHGSSQPPAAVPAAKPAASSAPRLVAHRLGQSALSLSLPPTYSLHLTEGADFLVYSFAATDTTAVELFTGGLYLGGFPQPFDSAVGCRTRRLQRPLLGRPATWQLSQCATGYTLNVLAALPAGPAYFQQIHLFGQARSAAGLRQLLAVASTLQYKPLGKSPGLPATQ